jgi:hypothetical protein
MHSSTSFAISMARTFSQRRGGVEQSHRADAGGFS